MNTETKITLGIGSLTLVVLGVIAAVGGKSSSSSQPTKVDQAKLVRDYSPKISADNAKVTVVEFADFQCPACGAAHPVTKQILNEYKGKINFVYRNFPLPIHKNAVAGAKAAGAAGLQGKFWEMHDKLFDNQTKWSENKNPEIVFADYAKELGLDVEKFKGDMKNKTVEEHINLDSGDADALKLDSTPTFFINDKKETGILTYEVFKQKIEEQLKK